MKELEKQFDEAMFTIYRRAKEEAGYRANIFLGMLNDRRGRSTAKYLINAPKESHGYTALSERGRLDLTVEAVGIENKKGHERVDEEELKKARKDADKWEKN